MEEFHKERAVLCTQMALFMMENGKMVTLMAMEFCISQMEVNMKAIGAKASIMARVHMSQNRMQSMKENGKMENIMESVLSFGQMGQYTKVSGASAQKMAVVSLSV